MFMLRRRSSLAKRRTRWHMRYGSFAVYAAQDDRAREHAHEIADALAGDGADGVVLVAVLLRVGANFFGVAFDRGVELRSADDARLLGERARIGFELARNHLRVM